VSDHKLILETNRLRLRQLERTDIVTFSTYRSDSNIARYQGWDAPYTIEQAEKFIDDMQAVTPGEIGQWFQLGLELKSTAVLIGDVAFQVLKNNKRTAEIGMTLAAEYHGSGYGVEGVTELVRFLFDDLQMHRVIANCDPENHSAIRLLEKVGFRREGSFLESLWYKGYWASEYWYAMLEREWKEKTT
jgi:RimJ/RimL family protein N-acetyltransferase